MVAPEARNTGLRFPKHSFGYEGTSFHRDVTLVPADATCFHWLYPWEVVVQAHRLFSQGFRLGHESYCCRPRRADDPRLYLINIIPYR